MSKTDSNLPIHLPAKTHKWTKYKISKWYFYIFEHMHVNTYMKKERSHI